jgi:pimeloyl-ACP methyl ester carboxylesterase
MPRSAEFALATAIGALVCLPSLAADVDVAPQRHVVGGKAPKAFVPYKASHSLSEPNRRITRILFSIHSSGFDALAYFNNARAAAAKVRGAEPETLIVAPQFFEKRAVPGPIPEGMLFWRVSPFRGSSQGAVGAEEKRVSISAFEVLDQWLTALTDRKRFPQLRDVVLFGHSGGGQFVQRYAMVGAFDPPKGVKCRYVTSAPSSYAYPSGERFDPRTKKVAVPDAKTLAACPDYNRWGYGLEAPYAYFSKTAADAVAKRYAERSVFYLCGANDSDPDDAALGKSCGAMLQGRHRLERMQHFKAYLDHKYGKAIAGRHRFAVVPKVGHFGRGTMTSESGLEFLFSPIK